ncbi:ATP-binding protein [Sphaerisporangium krabiense]|uniref:Anti-sigma regulatory factor (Ser/Thr protein kinase) n=1 Tax=Sphaerisporangium krabiense TaxID=763782 RepID=A0A7W9DST6_9ACTN|nr:ATP-binding protein [Sphaerisporangium krabiense]MBB5629454.1 anti-sigma regulatory factor (Ser/Thr protein kinase) [Sphaerisporangium krabiense]GII65696.1 ATP-binding protein [Sphaerisporangium krabiense]
MTTGDQVVRHGGEVAAGGWRRALPAVEASVPVARAWARDLLAVWIVAPALDDVLLLLSEVVTNAVTHSDSGRSPDGRVRLRVALLSRVRGVHVEVADDGAAGEAPVARPAEVGSAGGRGLWLVSEIASAWGSSPRDDGPGRSVWFQVVE